MCATRHREVSGKRTSGLLSFESQKNNVSSSLKKGVDGCFCFEELICDVRQSRNRYESAVAGERSVPNVSDKHNSATIQRKKELIKESKASGRRVGVAPTVLPQQSTQT